MPTNNTAKPKISLAVVMPLGPNDDPIDTIKSIRHYTTKSRVIVVVDDTKKADIPAKLRALGSDVHVITAGDYPGGYGGLWVKLAQGYRYLYEMYDFKVLLRIDADALVIGPHPEVDAIDYFRANPTIGLIGSYRVNCNGDARSFADPAKCLRIETSLLGLIRPAVRRTLRKALSLVKTQGYEYGEHCLGGAYFHSPACVQALYQNGWLNHPELKRSNLGEDQLFALATKAVGFNMGDFATGNYPMGLSWRGLPCSPAELVARKKKITHSVREWQGMDERAIRDFFAKRRGE